jgi:hypothetical protein
MSFNSLEFARTLLPMPVTRCMPGAGNDDAPIFDARDEGRRPGCRLFRSLWKESAETTSNQRAQPDHNRLIFEVADKA